MNADTWSTRTGSAAGYRRASFAAMAPALPSGPTSDQISVAVSRKL
jgi:hypothetical protein